MRTIINWQTGLYSAGDPRRLVVHRRNKQPEGIVFTIDQALAYLGDRETAPINRTITAPYGAHHDVVSFRGYVGPDHAEVMTSRGSRIVRLDLLLAR